MNVEDQIPNWIFSFHRPEIFWLLVPGFLILGFVAFWEWRKREKVFRFLGMKPSLDSWLKKYGLLVSLALLLVLAAAGLYQKLDKDKTEQLFSESEIAVVFDVSYSMSAQKTEGFPTRLGRVKQVSLALLPRLEGNKVGVYAFTRVLASHLPLTSDLQVVRMTIQELVQIESVPKPGSDIGRALWITAEKFEDGSGKKVVVLFTDGENTGSEDLLNGAVEKIKQKGIKLIIVGVGEKEGRDLDILDSEGKPTGKYHRTYLNENLLMDIARKSSGAYMLDNNMNLLLVSLKRFGVTAKIAEVSKDTREFYQFFLLAALVPWWILLRYHR